MSWEGKIPCDSLHCIICFTVAFWNYTCKSMQYALFCLASICGAPMVSEVLSSTLGFHGKETAVTLLDVGCVYILINPSEVGYIMKRNPLSGHSIANTIAELHNVAHLSVSVWQDRVAHCPAEHWKAGSSQSIAVSGKEPNSKYKTRPHCMCSFSTVAELRNPKLKRSKHGHPYKHVYCKKRKIWEGFEGKKAF